MAIVAKNTGGTAYEPLEAGNYPARCISMIRIGTIEEEYLGKKKWMDKVALTFEIPDEQKVFVEAKGMQPFVFTRDYTLSMYEKANLRKTLENWRGKAFTNEQADAFDITALVGKPCLLNIIHKQSGDKTYANIAGVSAMPKGMTCSPQINDSVVFNVEEFDQEVFDTLSEYTQNKIKRSKEYLLFKNPNVTHDEPSFNQDVPTINVPADEDDLPF